MGVYKQELYKYIYDFIGNDVDATDAKDAILTKIADASFVLNHATVSALEPKDGLGQNRSEQVLNLLCAQFGVAAPTAGPTEPPVTTAMDPMNHPNPRTVDDAAVVTVLTPIKNSLSDLCDGAQCEVDSTLVGKTGMAKAYKFIMEAIVDMGDSSDFDETTTIDNELIISYNYNTN